MHWLGYLLAGKAPKITCRHCLLIDGAIDPDPGDRQIAVRERRPGRKLTGRDDDGLRGGRGAPERDGAGDGDEQEEESEDCSDIEMARPAQGTHRRENGGRHGSARPRQRCRAPASLAFSKGRAIRVVAHQGRTNHRYPPQPIHVLQS